MWKTPSFTVSRRMSANNLYALRRNLGPGTIGHNLTDPISCKTSNRGDERNFLIQKGQFLQPK